MESDPIGLAGGLNRYNYVDSAPLQNLDPLGLYRIDPASCQAHPALCRRVKSYIDRITKRQRKAFRDVTGATDAQIDETLTPGCGPLVTFDEIDKATSPANYQPATQTITIDPRKAGSRSWRNLYRFRRGGFDRILGHETAHHLDNLVTGNRDTTREEGNEWEDRVYGR